MKRFEEFNAQVLGISVDSVFSHRAFADELGGISFPLLADFHPKGAVSMAYGVWNENFGDSYRAIFIVDTDGIVRHSEHIPKGTPDVNEVLEQVRTIADA